jgi:ribonuclease P protein component
MPRSGSGSPRRRRLTRSGDFKRAYRDGSSKATRYLVLYRFDRSEDEAGDARLGISVSRKLGDSVTRNRIKRVLKEAFWSTVDRDSAGHDFVLVARASIGQVVEDRGLEGAIECVRELTEGDSGEGSRST